MYSPFTNTASTSWSTVGTSYTLLTPRDWHQFLRAHGLDLHIQQQKNWSQPSPTVSCIAQSAAKVDLLTPRSLHLQSPHDGTVPGFFWYKYTSRPPGVLELNNKESASLLTVSLISLPPDHIAYLTTPANSHLSAIALCVVRQSPPKRYSLRHRRFYKSGEEERPWASRMRDMTVMP